MRWLSQQAKTSLGSQRNEQIQNLKKDVTTVANGDTRRNTVEKQSEEKSEQHTNS